MHVHTWKCIMLSHWSMCLPCALHNICFDLYIVSVYPQVLRKCKSVLFSVTSESAKVKDLESRFLLLSISLQYLKYVALEPRVEKCRNLEPGNSNSGPTDLFPLLRLLCFRDYAFLLLSQSSVMTSGFWNWDLFKPPGVLVTVHNMHMLIIVED